MALPSQAVLWEPRQKGWEWEDLWNSQSLSSNGEKSLAVPLAQ